MKFTMKNYLKEIMKPVAQELKLLHFSHRVWIILASLLVIFCGVFFLNYQSVKEFHNEYQWDLGIAIADGDDIEASLAADYSVTKEKTGFLTSTTTIHNPLAYSKATLEKTLFAASPAYSVSLVTESSYPFILPLLFGLTGVFLGTYDFSNRTVKLCLGRLHRWQYGIAKHITLVIVTLGLFVLVILASLIMSGVTYSMLTRDAGMSAFVTTFEQKGMFLKLLFAYAMGLLFAEIGLTLALTFKKAAIGVIALFGYIYLVPDLGKYDPKSMANVIGSKIYDFYGTTTLVTVHDTPVAVAVLLLVMFLVITVGVGVLLLNRRSMYE